MSVSDGVASAVELVTSAMPSAKGSNQRIAACSHVPNPPVNSLMVAAA
jgi:hypothetical protein